MTAIKSLLFLIFAASLGAGYIPLVLLPKSPRFETGIFAYLAFPFWLLGGAAILWCFWDFTLLALDDGDSSPFFSIFLGLLHGKSAKKLTEKKKRSIVKKELRGLV